MDLVNEPMPKVPVSVVVAVSPPERFELVPQAKPRIVEEELPPEVIDPFRVMVEVETRVASEVVRVGGTRVAVGVTAFEADEGELVPTRFTAYTANVYYVLLVRPRTTIGETVEVAVKLPGVDEAR
jgi:hypothetical protein